MSAALAIAGWSLFVVAVMAGIVLNLVGLFGNWVILAALVALWACTGLVHFGALALIALAGLAVLGEVLEMLASSYGASKFGGGKGAMAAALVGCIAGAIVGTPWFPIVGTLIGACLGAFAGAAGYEVLITQKDARTAAWTGLGAALGKIGGLLAKFAMGVIMLVVALLTY